MNDTKEHKVAAVIGATLGIAFEQVVLWWAALSTSDVLMWLLWGLVGLRVLDLGIKTGRADQRRQQSEAMSDLRAEIRKVNEVRQQVRDLRGAVNVPRNRRVD